MDRYTFDNLPIMEQIKDITKNVMLGSDLVTTSSIVISESLFFDKLSFITFNSVFKSSTFTICSSYIR